MVNHGPARPKEIEKIVKAAITGGWSKQLWLLLEIGETAMAVAGDSQNSYGCG